MKTHANSPIAVEIPESTISAVVIGLVLAIVMGAANVYLGLYAGMTVSASIPAAVISMAIMKGIFRRGTILENNISQTLASTGETLAAGAIFTIPALVLSGAWDTFHYWETTLIIMLGGTLGVVFMVPLRRALIVDRPDLTYPEGVACSKVLIAGHEGGAGVKWIGFGLALGTVFKYLVSSLGLVMATVQGAVAAGRSVFYIGSDMSLALVSVGYIVNFRVAMQVFAGGVIGWVIAIPLLGGYTGEGSPVEYADALGKSQVRFLGVGCMLVGGIYSIWSVRTGVLGALAGLRGMSAAGGKAVARTDRDMSMMSLAVLLMIAVVATAALYDVLIGSLGVAIAATLIMVAASFIFAAVATYICGLVGSSNSPVSGMTICALLMAAGVLMALGVKGESAILATLGVAGVVCCATCAAGDMAQDLKTGQLVGSTPKRQQQMQVASVVVTAFIFAPVMTL
ncbi:MAG: oligopeptide transporter, OPT family, partial [Candidatus Hydrogenedentota bacterium]